MQAPLRIFLNYRREDAPGHAGRLYDALAERFGKDNVFMDVDMISPGEDFTEVLDLAVSGCDSFIAVIGREWNAAATADGARRLDDPRDFVRLEIEAALERRVLVIPALVEGATMPRPDELPGGLAALSRRQAAVLSDERWRYDVGRLIEILERRLAETASASGSPPTEADQPHSPAAAAAPVTETPSASRSRLRAPRVVWIALAAVAAGLAAAGAYFAASSSGSSIQLDGHVFDSRTHRPAAGILVASKGKSVRTAHDGGFTLGVSKDAPVQISGCGYASTTIHAPADSRTKPISLRPVPAVGEVISDFSRRPLTRGLAWQQGDMQSPLTYNADRDRLLAYGACPGKAIRVTAPGHAPSSIRVDAHRRFQALLHFTRIHDSSPVQLMEVRQGTASRGFYQRGHYFIVSTGSGSDTFDLKSKPLIDVQLDAKVVLESGTTNDFVEFICRSTRKPGTMTVKSEYDLFFSNDGYVQIARYTDGDFKLLKPSRASTTIDTGAGVRNDISARCVGRKRVALELWINHVLAARAVDAHGLPRGNVGLGLNPYGRPLPRVRFEDISVRRLAEH